MRMSVDYEVEADYGTVLLKVVRAGGNGTQSEGIRVPFELIEETIQALTDAARDAGVDLM